MSRYAPNGLKLKIFVREREISPDTAPKTPSLKYVTVAPLSGDKAKEFYESLINDRPSTQTKPQNPPIKLQVKKKSKQSQNTSFKDSDLLAFAQRNDISNLKKFFSQKPNCDVNIVDDFGWTPLMCASCSGAEEAVKILLKNNADPSIKDKLGYTALKLARLKNQIKIVTLLENKCLPRKVIVKDEADKPEKYFCTVCKDNVSVSKAKHESSTLHLFHCKVKTTTHYGIPECNRGFQLLLKEGWNKEKGLGPHGSGRKFPVKAVMKKDRTGIGAPPSPSNKRGNHFFENFDNKKIRTYRTMQDKNFEKNFRLEFA